MYCIPTGLPFFRCLRFTRGQPRSKPTEQEERIAEFADAGIFRRYTNDDYEARLRAAGFEVVAFRANDLPEDVVRMFQLKEEVLHLCRKKP